jgi:hypothetical protein
LKFFAGSGSVTEGYGFGSGYETEDAPYQKSSKKPKK